MSRSVTIEIPASTSNLGGGFDCVGVALSLWLRATVRLTAHGSPRTGLLHRAFRAACRHAGLDRRIGIEVEIESEIPIARGLGSSAACVVAGIQAAGELLQLGLDSNAQLVIGTSLEGHPENVAAILGGGAVLVAGSHIAPIEIHPELAFVIACPEFAVHTESARSILPHAVPHQVAAAAAARGAALVRGLASADEALLAFAFDDVLHVPYRRRLVPGFADVAAAARGAGAIGATLSGSGSSILALARPDVAAAVGDAMQAAWSRAGVASEVFHPSIVKELVPCR